MSQAHKIILVGFSSFERVTFESFFRLAARRPPGYLLVEDTSQAHLAIVNADDPAVLRQCIAAKPASQVLLIGSQDGGTGWMLQRRPLNLMRVLATIESLLVTQASTELADVAAYAAVLPVIAAKPVVQATPLAAPPIAASQGLATVPLQAVLSTPVSGGAESSLRRTVRTGVGGRRDFAHSTSQDNFTGLSAASVSPKNSEMDLDLILVVDDSDIALKFMRNRLSRFGFHADLVNSGEEALGKMNTRPYKFVFLDVMMEGLDGYQTCRAIKQRKYSDGKPPVVVMLTSRGGTIDKIRGTLAGCDAYLTKPLNERDLIAVLAKHDRTVARGFQETNFGTNNGSGFGKSVK